MRRQHAHVQGVRAWSVIATLFVIFSACDDVASTEEITRADPDTHTTDADHVGDAAVSTDLPEAGVDTLDEDTNTLDSVNSDGTDADAGGPDTGMVVSTRVCGELTNEWCWAHGAPLRVIDGSLAHGLYAGGLGGTLVRWTAGAWEQLPMPMYHDITDLHVAAADSLWVLAEGLWHFDGAAWRLVNDTTCRALAGTGPDDVWAYHGCTPMHFDGDRWRQVPLGEDATLDAYALLARGSSEAWASVSRPLAEGVEISSHVAFMRFDGVSWQRMGEPFQNVSTSRRYSMIELDGRVVAYDLMHPDALSFDGERWQPAVDLNIPDIGEGEALLYTTRGGFVGVDSRCAQPRAWDVSDHRRTGFAVRLDDGDVFCTSGDGEAYRRTKGVWEKTPYDAFTQTLTPAAWGQVPAQLWAHDAELAWGDRPNHVLRVQTTLNDAGGPQSERLSHYDGTTWRTLKEDSRYYWQLEGAGDGTVWLILGAEIWRFDGLDVQRVTVPSALGAVRFFAAHTLSNGETYFTAADSGVDALSDALLVRFNDGQWDVVERWPQTSPEHVHFSFSSITGHSAETLQISATSPDDYRVLLSRGPNGWSQVRLWHKNTYMPLEIAVDGNTLWIDGVQLNNAQPSPEETTHLDRAPFSQASMRWGYRAPRLYVDDTKIWLISRGKAVYRNRQQ